MKIGILTHPIHGNYGGMLQAFALQTTLERMGHRTELLKYVSFPEHEFIKNIPIHIKYLIRKFLSLAGFFPSHPPIRPFLRQKIAKDFEMQFLHTSSPVQVADIARDNIQFDYDTWVVGSDQVWRGAYVRSIVSLPFFFLNFIPEDIRRRSISYAASFGTDVWEGTPQETEECKRLLNEFKAVSSREFGGVRICREILGRSCEQMPDPALLLNSTDYEHIIENEQLAPIEKDYIAAYILDETPEKRAFMREIADQELLDIQEVRHHCIISPHNNRIPCSVGRWLRHLRDSRLVLTDSFHGCVFSMIFNKPFICMENSARGTNRFESLFQMVGEQTGPLGTIHKVDRDKLKAIATQGKKYLQRNLSPHVIHE